MLNFAKRLIAAAFLLAALPVVAAELTVSAAASLNNAFKEAGQAYEALHPATKVLFNFAASDVLVQQIAKGAPVDIFASADQEAMDKAQEQKLILEGSRKNFVANALVLITPLDSALKLKALGDLQQAGVKRIALGNPAIVPAGRYAKHALDAQKMWPALESKAIFAQNVRQALDYVARAEVDAGFVYTTDAAIQKEKVRVAFVVPTEIPITYPIAIVNGSAQAADAKNFIDYLQTPAGQAILGKHGFLKP
ncbi:MAG: molybdate ABC transporter substrate-binding protein [Pseudomonadota bacterium]